MEQISTRKNIEQELDKFNSKIKKMSNLENFNTEQLISSYNHHINNLDYFYSVLCKNDNPDDVIFHHPDIHSHTLVYVNLEVGFPKELMCGHWCYVVKMIGNCKALIIPTTSIKEKYINNYDSIIESESNGNIIYSSLKYSEIRTIDLQRIYFKKGFKKVKTKKCDIIKGLLNLVI